MTSLTNHDCSKPNLSLRRKALSEQEEDEFVRVVKILWKKAEKELVCLSHDNQLPLIDLNSIDINANSLKDALTCIGKIDRHLVTHKYKEAIHLLRSCRKFFENSQKAGIKDLFWDMNELDKLHDIYVVLRLVTHLGIVRTLSILEAC